jgi:hypothetical protein
MIDPTITAEHEPAMVTLKGLARRVRNFWTTGFDTYAPGRNRVPTAMQSK